LDSDIRLYFDEGVQVAVAEQMRHRGIDVVSARDLGSLGDEDINHLQRASAMGRVVCTFDYDFLRLHGQGIRHAGIIIARHFDTTIGDWVRGLELICGAMTADDMKNHIEYP
jgi:predicted nuclease of predicted toxin-antitoxin system